MKKDGNLWGVGFLSSWRLIHMTWISSTSMPHQRAAHRTRWHFRVPAVLTAHDLPVSSKCYPGHSVGMAQSSPSWTFLVQPLTHYTCSLRWADHTLLCWNKKIFAIELINLNWVLKKFILLSSQFNTVVCFPPLVYSDFFFSSQIKEKTQ